MLGGASARRIAQYAEGMELLICAWIRCKTSRIGERLVQIKREAQACTAL